jgi:hypothetical protein
MNPLTPARRILLFLVAVGLPGLCLLAWTTGTWALTGAAVGFVFGFAMQRARFCGAAIASSVVLLREGRGMLGAAAAILVAMLCFGALAAAGLVTPNPKILRLLPAITGGLVFGVGTVLGGGCVSGCLFKAGEGRLNTMLSLVGIAMGVGMTSSGVLAPMRRWLEAQTESIRPPASLDRLAGVPFHWLALAIGATGLTAVLLIERHRRRRSPRNDVRRSWRQRIQGGWSFMFAGIFIGVLQSLAYLTSAAAGRNYPLGPTRGVQSLFAMALGIPVDPGWWLASGVLAIVVGSAVSAWLRGELALRSADATTLLVSLGGGLLIGIGAILGDGCFVGNVLSGWALLSLHSIIFGITALLANWATTIVYLRGL